MTSRLKKIISILVIIVFTIYLFLQFFVFTKETRIELYKYPKKTVQSEVLLRGKVIGSKKFFIASKEVSLDESLEFQKEIFLFKGLNKIKLELQTKDDNFIEKDIQIFRTKKP